MPTTPTLRVTVQNRPRLSGRTFFRAEVTLDGETLGLGFGGDQAEAVETARRLATLRVRQATEAEVPATVDAEAIWFAPLEVLPALPATAPRPLPGVPVAPAPVAPALGPQG